MRYLCVAEKGSISKAVTGILSGGDSRTRNTGNKYIKNYDFNYRLPGHPGHITFVMTAVSGHVTEVEFDPVYKSWKSCDPIVLFEAKIHTSVSKGNKEIEKNLKQEARLATHLMIWTDCDREGEHIGSEIASICQSSNRNIVVQRARFSAIIPAQIHNAVQNPVALDMLQAVAVEARIHLDLRLGAAFTRMQTLSLQARFGQLQNNIVSYGPCQFPTLGFVVDRYERAQNFVSETFYYIYVSLNREDLNDNDTSVKFTWARHHLFDGLITLLLYEMCLENPVARVTKVETKSTKKWKPLPLTTVELQKTGSRLLRLSPKTILEISEKLYQQGFLSYPRTETDQYDQAFDFSALLQKQVNDTDWGGFAQELCNGGFERPRNGKKNDKAHPPIHPTAHAPALRGDEKRVYELITRRFLGSCSRDATGNTTTIKISIGAEEFSTNGLVILQRNYLNVYTYDKWAGSILPDFREGEEFMPTVCEMREGQTTAPPYLTEADLVSIMDKNGIGTDATIAQHISTVIDRAYVMKQKKDGVDYLIPSTLGIGLMHGYEAMNLERSLGKPQLRRETEHRIQLICDGISSKNDVLEQTLREYREVYLQVKRKLNVLSENVGRYLEGNIVRE